MSPTPEWTIVAYDETGANPVGKFIESLQPKAQVSLAWAMEQLRIRNIWAQEPLVRHVDGKIWELRREIDTNSYRILYSAASAEDLSCYTPSKRKHGRRQSARYRSPVGDLRTSKGESDRRSEV